MRKSADSCQPGGGSAHSSIEKTVMIAGLGREQLPRGHIENHWVPYFKNRDLRDIREADLLRFIRVKLDKGLSPRTIGNILSILRRVHHLLQRDELVTRNPASRLGELDAPRGAGDGDGDSGRSLLDNSIKRK